MTTSLQVVQTQGTSKPPRELKAEALKAVSYLKIQTQWIWGGNRDIKFLIAPEKILEISHGWSFALDTAPVFHSAFHQHVAEHQHAVDNLFLLVG